MKTVCAPTMRIGEFVAPEQLFRSLNNSERSNPARGRRRREQLAVTTSSAHRLNILGAIFVEILLFKDPTAGPKIIHDSTGKIALIKRGRPFITQLSQHASQIGLPPTPADLRHAV